MEQPREMVRGVLSPGSNFREVYLRGDQWEYVVKDCVGVQG